MGLAIEVGILIDLKANDEEGFRRWKEAFDKLNRVLRDQRVPEHREPVEAKGLPWSADLYGYSGIHHLRRLAAHLWSGQGLPAAAVAEPVQDPVLERFYDPNFIRPNGGPSFEHLMDHSDAEGFYVPLDFEYAIFCDVEEAPGGMIGSTVRLKAELDRLSEALHVPKGLDPDSDEVGSAIEQPIASGPVWKRHGIATYVLLQLQTACSLSLLHKAAIAFT